MSPAISRRTALLGATAALLAPPPHASAASAVPFRHTAAADALADLRQRLRGARWPEGETANAQLGREAVPEPGLLERAGPRRAFRTARGSGAVRARAAQLLPLAAFEMSPR